MTWTQIDAALERTRATINTAAVSMRRQFHQGQFKFELFSDKQKKVLSWWCQDSPVKDSNGVIADGSIRSGKTLSMSLSFVFWAMTSFDGCNLAICGKTIGSLRRNVIIWLKLMLRSRGYSVQERRTDNLLIVRRDSTLNFFYFFGGRDERSQDLIQGITLAGVLFDEVALMPESFVNQATARCSVDGSKWWFNCNPQGPAHWFYVKWIKRCRSLGILYLHFTMDDNLSLSEDIKGRYRKKYDGVFFLRYILGRWVAAEGAIYLTFANNPENYKVDVPADDDEREIWVRKQFDFIQIGVDFGGNKSYHAFVASGLKYDYSTLTAIMSERHEAKGSDPDAMYALLGKFIQRVRQKYGKVKMIFADSAEQIIINGMRKKTDIPVQNSVKNEIIDRIRAATTLIAQGRFYYTEDCQTLVDALSAAIYDPKKFEDVRLDDGTSDIDTLDAWEYSWERYIKRYVRGVGRDAPED